MPDPCENYNQLMMDAPAQSGFTISASGSDMAKFTRGIYVAVGGAPTVQFVDGSSAAVTLTGLLAGTIYPFRLRQVTALGGATLIGLF